MAHPEPGRGAQQPFELAEEQYQAPFGLAPREPSAEGEQRAYSHSPSSSFFDEAELREAQAYVQGGDSHQASGMPARRRKRRDSQVGSYEDVNSIYDGPVAESVPSSVSNMHHVMSRPSFHAYDESRRRRRASQRRGRMGSRRSSSHTRGSRDPSPVSDRTHAESSQAPSSISYRKRSIPRARSQDGASTSVGTPGLIGSLFASLRGEQGEQATPLTQGDLDEELASDQDEETDATEDDELEAEEDEMDDDDRSSGRSSTSSRRRESPVGRLVPTVFGEYDEPAVFDGEEREEPPFHDPAFAQKPMHLRDYPDAVPMLDEHPGAPEEEAQKYSVWLDKTCQSRQQIYLADEDTLIRITGFRTLVARAVLYQGVCLLTLGIVPLLARWFPKMRLELLHEEAPFAHAEFVAVEDQWGQLDTVGFWKFPFARPMRTVFPPCSCDPPCTHAQSQQMASGGPPPPSDTDPEAVIDPVMFEHRYARFVLHPPSGRFRMIKDWRDGAWTSAAAMRKGVSSEVQHEREALFGPNLIEIAAKSTWGLLVDEVLHPFYIFQIVSIVLWCLDDYYWYALCIALISVGSIASTLVETHRTVTRMREMNRFSCTVRVLRDGDWVDTESSTLVPGDVYDAADARLTVMPADSVLLTGDAIMNESMLTGESVPISKAPVTDAALAALQHARGDVSSALAKHFLFAGTKVIRIRPTVTAEETSAQAVVVRTGFNTTKGSLVRGMLFPKPMGFKFYRDSFRFIGFLAAIAGVGFCFNTVNFMQLGIAWSTLLLRVLDLITVVVPPALPATMSIGTAFAIVRLRQQGVYCISPTRVNMGGKVNVVCFDKTGTLTEDGLDVLGARTVDPRTQQFRELHQSAAEIPTSAADVGEARHLPLLHALATCHSLKLVDGEVIGDPLDVKMFEFTGWELDEGDSMPGNKYAERSPGLVQSVVRPPGGPAFEAQDAMRAGRHAHFLELGVMRTFEFVSSLRRMSVVVKRLKASSMEVFVKGAPEALLDICDRSTLPDDFDDLLSYYTQHGYRVIACAGKTIPNMGWVEAQRMPRVAAESELRFLGLIVFENKLKPGSAPAIATLANAHIGCKMVTGDNPRTAISVARECGILGQSTSVFLPEFEHGSPEEPTEARLGWTSTDDEQVRLDPDSLKPRDLDAEVPVSEYALVLTGDVFRWMMDFAPIESVRRMLIKGTIFARMSPDEKHELVSRLQDLGYTVGMCGDGANDCGALKAADIGISLSEAEASVAAPFTSTRPDISCVIEVIKEGRAALVTSFSCFKYMALYSLIQFTSISILYGLASSLGDFQFLYIDLFIILPVAVAMARTRPYPSLHTKRPTANLVSKKVLVSMIGQVVICAGAQAFTFWFVRQQPWYERPIVNPDKLNVVNYENSALFLVSSFQYITVAGVFSVGPPYRLPIYTNPLLLASLTTLTALSTYFLFTDEGFFFRLLDLVSFPPSFHWMLFAIVAVNTAACFAFESLLAGPTLQAIKFLQRHLHHRHGKSRKHNRKAYKAVLSSLNDPADA